MPIARQELYQPERIDRSQHPDFTEVEISSVETMFDLNAILNGWGVEKDMWLGLSGIVDKELAFPRGRRAHLHYARTTKHNPGHVSITRGKIKAELPLPVTLERQIPGEGSTGVEVLIIRGANKYISLDRNGNLAQYDNN